ncbi:BCCT family transporter [Marinibactrum halimedae]|uniref:BCCT family transporter n=2 Tax=Marinibactrum halimedae TaxID=1444977 RepID=A0AA37T7E1_9GAMM|nr:BCCT family transporter [Marinibactrum halimedae]
MVVLVATVVASLTNLERFLTVANRINHWILDTFTSAFAIGTFGLVVSCIWVFASPLGKIRIGGSNATPLLSRWNWFAITLCTTVAIGILFWATAEPMFHAYSPGKAGIQPGSDAAEEFAMVSMFMHWSFTPYAIYALPALTFSLAHYNFNQPYSLSGPIAVLIGRPVPKVLSDIIDATALLALVAGLASSLGTGMLSLSGGVGNFIDISTSPLILAIIGSLIVTAFVISSVTGLQKGIRILSDINTKFFFAFAAFVLLAGPTLDLLMIGAKAFLGYLSEFFSRSLLVGDTTQPDWAKSWTIFYWANWLAWAPMTAVFLGRIARGYTVREFITVNFFLPALFSMIWITIFGGLSIEVNHSENEILKSTLDTDGPEAVLYTVIDYLPFTQVLAVILLLLSFVSYVTAADSNTDAIATICQKDSHQKDNHQKDNHPKDDRHEQPGHSLTIKVVWAVMIGTSAWIMTAFSGVDGIRALSNLGGLPALVIVLIFNVALITMSTKHLKTLKNAEKKAATTME